MKAKRGSSKVTPGRGYATCTGRQYVGFAGQRITAPEQWTSTDTQQAWLEGYAAGVKAAQTESEAN